MRSRKKATKLNGKRNFQSKTNAGKEKQRKDDKSFPRKVYPVGMEDTTSEKIRYHKEKNEGNI